MTDDDVWGMDLIRLVLDPDFEDRFWTDLRTDWRRVYQPQSGPWWEGRPVWESAAYRRRPDRARRRGRSPHDAPSPGFENIVRMMEDDQ
jgi:hypothetical protein